MTMQSARSFSLIVSRIVSVAGWLAAIGLASVLLTGCAAQYNTHGHLFTKEDLSRVRVGMSKDQVKLVLGSPDTKSSVGGDAYYYISSKTRQIAFMAPKTIERKIVAVYFNDMGMATRVAHYGLQDGRVFDFVSGKTPSQGREYGLLEQLLGNLGKKISL